MEMEMQMQRNMWRAFCNNERLKYEPTEDAFRFLEISLERFTRLVGHLTELILKRRQGVEIETHHPSVIILILSEGVNAANGASFVFQRIGRPISETAEVLKRAQNQ